MCPMPDFAISQNRKSRSRNIGLGALLLLCGERIEIDDPGIILTGIAIEPSAAMNVHQGLHTSGI